MNPSFRATKLSNYTPTVSAKDLYATSGSAVGSSDEYFYNSFTIFPEPFCDISRLNIIEA
jgi:hypothetical protein